MMSSGAWSRPIHPVRPTLSVSYSGRPDAYGGVNGVVSTQTMGKRHVKNTSDGLGRGIKTSHKAFDGTFVYEDVAYDALGQ